MLARRVTLLRLPGLLEWWARGRRLMPPMGAMIWYPSFFTCDFSTAMRTLMARYSWGLLPTIDS